MNSLIRQSVGIGDYSKSGRIPGRAKIMVIGCGGAGCNTINRLSKVGVRGAQTVAINTDKLHLDTVNSNLKFLVGSELTKGLGAGGFPEIGHEAATHEIGRFKELLGDSDLVFITAGMGGGTGTGAAPILAQVAKDEGALVIGVVTMPFSMEGDARFKKAKDGLLRFRQSCDTVVVIDNNRLLDLCPDFPIDYAFSLADQILAEMVKGITETIMFPSLINLDFADVRAVMADGGVAMVGIGETSMEGDKATQAVNDAMEKRLLSVDYDGAVGALIHVTGGSNMSLAEANKIGDLIRNKLTPDANIVWGARVDEAMGDNIRVILIITGVKSPYIQGPADGPISPQKYSYDTSLDSGFNSGYFSKMNSQKAMQKYPWAPVKEKRPFSLRDFGLDIL